ERMQKAEKSQYAAMFLRQLSVSMQQAIELRSNTTTLSYSPQHGTQVSYSADDGRIFLWYPGNPEILHGNWRTCEERMGSQLESGERISIPIGKVCFQYGPNTYNPVTGAVGDVWECSIAGRLEETLVERRRGDVLGLMKRASVPFVLPKEQTTINDLL